MVHGLILKIKLSSHSLSTSSSRALSAASFTASASAALCSSSAIASLIFSAFSSRADTPERGSDLAEGEQTNKGQCDPVAAPVAAV